MKQSSSQRKKPQQKQKQQSSLLQYDELDEGEPGETLRTSNRRNNVRAAAANSHRSLSSVLQQIVAEQNQENASQSQSQRRRYDVVTPTPKFQNKDDGEEKRIHSGRQLARTLTSSNTTDEGNNNNNNTSRIDHDADIHIEMSEYIIWKWFQKQILKIYNHRLKDDTSDEIWINHNVFVMLTLALLFGAANSIWIWTINGAYMDVDISKGILSNDDFNDDGGRGEDLGNTPMAAYVTSTAGAISVFLALPIGYCLETSRQPARLVAIAGRIVIVLSIVLIVLLSTIDMAETEENMNNHNGSGDNEGGQHFHDNNSVDDDPLSDDAYNVTFWLYAAMLQLWAIIAVVIEGPALYLFIYSIPTSKRAVKGLMEWYVAMTVLGFVGPVLSMVFTAIDGEGQWSQQHIRVVMMIALILTVHVGFVMTCFDDDKMLRTPLPFLTHRDSLNLQDNDRIENERFAPSLSRSNSIPKHPSLSRSNSIPKHPPLSRSNSIPKHPPLYRNNSIPKSDQSHSRNVWSPSNLNMMTCRVITYDVDDHDKKTSQKEMIEPLLLPGNANDDDDDMSTSTTTSIRINNCFTRCIKYTPWKMEQWDYGIYIGITTAIQGFGTGLSEVYFRRIFSSEESELSNFETSLVYLALPFVLIIGFYCSYLLSQCIGRVQTILCFEFTGSICMFLLSVYTADLNAVAVPIYLSKCALLWGSIPLETSVICDLSSKRKLFALSLTMYASVQFSWDAGAAIGQIIQDNAEEYNLVVLVAAVMQLFGTTMYIPLLPVVNKFDEEFLQSEEEHFATCHSIKSRRRAGSSAVSVSSSRSMRSTRNGMTFACQSCNSPVVSGGAIL